MVELAPFIDVAKLAFCLVALLDMEIGCEASRGGRFRRQIQRQKSKMIRLRRGTAKAKLANLKKKAIQVMIFQISAGIKPVWKECANQVMVRSVGILFIMGKWMY